MTDQIKTTIMPRQIARDIEMLKNCPYAWDSRNRRFFGTTGFAVMAYAELAGSMTALWVGWGLVTIAIIGVLQRKRRDRVLAWFAGVQNV